MKTNSTAHPEQKSLRWKIVVGGAFFIASVGIIKYGIKYFQNHALLEISYQEWVKEKPDNEWLKISEAKADLLNTFYLESVLLPNSKPKQFFIPLISADTNFQNAKIHLLIRVAKGDLYQKALKFNKMSEAESIRNFAKNPNQYLENGPFDGYKYFDNEEIEDKFIENIPNLSPDFKIIDLHKGFPFDELLVVTAMWIGLLIFIIKNKSAISTSSQ